MHPPKHPWIHPYCLLNIDKLRRVLVLKIFTAVLSTVVHKAKGGGASAPLAPPLVAPMASDIHSTFCSAAAENFRKLCKICYVVFNKE